MAKDYERITISLRPGMRDMLTREFPHQSTSAIISLLVEMAVDAGFIMTASKLKNMRGDITEEWGASQTTDQIPETKPVLLRVPTVPPLPPLAALVWSCSNCGNTNLKNYMHGTQWCSNCVEQEEQFGSF